LSRKNKSISKGIRLSTADDMISSSLRNFWVLKVSVACSLVVVVDDGRNYYDWTISLYDYKRFL
jgi:diphthamide synthase subunit DPH2